MISYQHLLFLLMDISPTLVFCLDRMWVISYLIQLCPLTPPISNLNLFITQGVSNSMPGSDVTFLISLISMFVILIGRE